MPFRCVDSTTGKSLLALVLRHGYGRGGRGGDSSATRHVAPPARSLPDGRRDPSRARLLPPPAAGDRAPTASTSRRPEAAHRSRPPRVPPAAQAAVGQPRPTRRRAQASGDRARAPARIRRRPSGSRAHPCARPRPPAPAVWRLPRQAAILGVSGAAPPDCRPRADIFQPRQRPGVPRG